MPYEEKKFLINHKKSVPLRQAEQPGFFHQERKVEKANLMCLCVISNEKKSCIFDQ